MCRYWTPAWNSTPVPAPDPSSASRSRTTWAAASDDGWPPAKSTMVPSGPMVTRLQR